MNDKHCHRFSKGPLPEVYLCLTLPRGGILNENGPERVPGRYRVLLGAVAGLKVRLPGMALSRVNPLSSNKMQPIVF
jgi:hypothetical protein